MGLPWSPLLPLAAWQALRRGPDAGSSRLLLGWMGLMTVLLSLSRGKIDYYLLPLLPPASLVLGHYLSAVPWGRLDRLWGRVVLLLVGAAGAALPVVLWQVPSAWRPPPAVVVAWAGLMGGAAACLLAAYAPTPRRALAAVAAASSPQPLLLLLQPHERPALAALPMLREVGEYLYLPASALTLRGFLAGLEPSTMILMRTG